MGELHIYDSEFESVRDTYAAKVTEIEADLNNYVSGVKAIQQNKDLEGQTADKLVEFAELVEETIRGELDDIFVRYKAITSQYAEEVATNDDAEL
jgi:hypothetical protein